MQSEMSNHDNLPASFSGKAAYVGIDLLDSALPAMADAGCEIMKIFTCKTDNVTEFNTRVCAFALERGIPLQMEKIRPSDLQALADAGCGLLLCGGYYYRLPVREDMYMVNIHPALLPVGRGAWPMPVTILRGLSESGVTFHRMTAGLDEGDILLQERLDVDPGETLESLTAKQRALLPGMVRRLVADLPGLWKKAVPQDSARAEYWPCPAEADWTVREGMSPEEADRILRAFYGYEVILETGGQRRELIRARLAEAPEEGWLAFPFGGRVVLAKKAREIT